MRLTVESESLIAALAGRAWIEDDAGAALAGTPLPGDVRRDPLGDGRWLCRPRDDEFEALARPLDGLGVGAWVAERPLGTVRWSQGLREMIGTRPGEPDAEATLLARVRPEERAAVVAERERVEREGGVYDLTVRLAAPPRVVRAVARPWEDHPGRILGLAFDVTRLADLESDVRRSEERYRAFLANSAEGIYRVDIEPPIRTTDPVENQIEHAYAHAYLAEGNDAMARMYGLESAEEMVGLRLGDLLPRDVPENLAYLRAFLTAGYRIEGAESHERAFDGSPRVFRNSLVGVPEGGLLRTVWGTQSDVTALRESERRFARIAEAAPEVVLLFEAATGRVEFVNERIRETLGWTREELVAYSDERPISLLHPDDVDAWVALRQRVLAAPGGEPLRGDFRFLHRDGRHRTMDAHLVPFDREADGRVRSVLVLLRDVSVERHRDRDFRAMLEGLPQMVWTTRPDGYHDYFNARWYDFVGYDPGGTDGTEMWNQLLHPDDQARARARWERSLRTGEDYEIEYRFRAQDGSYRWFLGQARAIRDPDGGITRWFGTCTDIHDALTTKEALRRESHRLQLALETAESGAWELDLTTNEVLWSPEMYELQGRPAPGQPLYEYAFSTMTPEDAARGAAAVEECRRTLGRLEFDFAINHPEKGRRYLRCRARAVPGPDGRPRALVGVTSDVTDEREAAAALERKVEERTEELQRANRELEGFTYTVSHDLRAPLRAIIANSRYLMEDLGDALDPDSRRMLERQGENARKLGTLIDDLLKLSRIGRQEMRAEPLDLSALAREVADEILARPNAPSVEFDVREGLTGVGDARLLRFVFLNLFENAAKFSPAGGRVTVDEEARAIRVRDQGIGFEPEYAEKMFLPFERLVRDDQFPGTGIGLANVKRIVERHGGRVWAEGRPGEGATFRFTLGVTADGAAR